jgi:hypothetical protein
VHGTLYDLSLQNLVDCDVYDDGCYGGTVEGALSYIINCQAGWLTTSDRYPWTGHEDQCHWDQATMQTVRINDFASVESDSEDALRDAVCAIDPVDCTIDAPTAAFQLYTGGIFDDPGCSSGGWYHEVMTVGYGSEGGVEYWITQNN